MKLVSLRGLEDRITQRIDDATRDSVIVGLDTVVLNGRNMYYPNCLIQFDTGNQLLNPYDERIMSLNKDSFYEGDTYTPMEYRRLLTEDTPVFFFIYNVDNYYHFIYDTLPFIYGFQQLKLTVPNLKLLINTSHPDKICLSRFVTEFLATVGVMTSDILFVSNTTTYTRMYIMSSLTHGQKSNEIYSLPAVQIWDRCVAPPIQTPNRFYISRRTWKHGQLENIGTNYTTRRKCMNEDAVVDMLEKYGIQEIFTELLTTAEKIAYFRNAELVVGVVGGGMCNLLFSPTNTKSLCITTPHFLEINHRFQHSMNHTKIIYSNCTTHYQKNVPIQLYSRVKVVNSSSDYCGYIGEVVDNTSDLYNVKLSSNDVAGFSQDFSMVTRSFWVSELEAIDHGLNSPYVCDIEQLESDLRSIL